MSATSPESLALLGRAAELRAEGTRWADAATKLAVPHDELRKLASEHAREYEKLARRARAEFHRDATAEAVATLRDLTRSDELGVRKLAATTLVRYGIALMRHGTKEAGERLARDARRPRKLNVGVQNTHAENVSESTEVPKNQEVNAAKKVAHPNAPVTAPKPTSAPPAAAGKSQAPLDDAAEASAPGARAPGYMPPPLRGYSKESLRHSDSDAPQG